MTQPRRTKSAAEPRKAVAEAPAPEPLSCRSCGGAAVYQTDGRAAEAVAYCQRDLPANVTREMVQRFQASR